MKLDHQIAHFELSAAREDMISNSNSTARQFVSLGMFIIDEFSFADEQGVPTGKITAPQVSHTRPKGI